VRVAIFGSCVTRDVFEDPELRPSLATYASRSALASAVSAPVGIEEHEVRLESAFQRRCVLEDFRKAFFDELAATPPDWLVIDLIDERFEFIRAGDSFVTRSLAFVEAGLDARFAGHQVVRRLTAEAQTLTERAAAEFARRVAGVLAPERVVIHRAYWMTHYRDRGTVAPLPADRRDFAVRHNSVLDQMYEVLTSAFDGRAHALDLRGEGHAADARHKWGLEPYHYEAAYNASAVRALKAIFASA
jgi:hypothetical protein